MTGILSFLIIVASALLILVVYVQNPKGGGLSADFGGASQLGGVQRTNELIDKLTWGLAAAGERNSYGYSACSHVIRGVCGKYRNWMRTEPD